MGDEYKKLSFDFLDIKNKPHKDLIKILSEINTLFQGVYKLYYNYKIDKAVENALLYDKLEKDIEDLFKSKKENFKIYHHLERIIQIIIQAQESVLLINI